VPFGYPRDEAVHEDPRFALLRAHPCPGDEEYEAQARQVAPPPIDTHERHDTGDDHDPSPQNPARAGAAASLGGLAAVAVAQPRPSCASAICTRRRSTARSGSASSRARGSKRGLDMELIQFTTGLSCSGR
jgi:hypothetical protein